MYDKKPQNSSNDQHKGHDKKETENKKAFATAGDTKPASTESNQSTTACFLCDDIGHWARDCPYKELIKQLKSSKNIICCDNNTSLTGSKKRRQRAL